MDNQWNKNPWLASCIRTLMPESAFVLTQLRLPFVINTAMQRFSWHDVDEMRWSLEVWENEGGSKLPR